MVQIASWRIAGKEGGHPGYVDGDELYIPRGYRTDGPSPESGRMVHVRYAHQDYWEVYTLGDSRIEEGESESWRVFELRDAGKDGGREAVDAER